jgi:hypothetical protein
MSKLAEIGVLGSHGGGGEWKVFENGGARFRVCVVEIDCALVDYENMVPALDKIDLVGLMKREPEVRSKKNLEINGRKT